MCPGAKRRHMWSWQLQLADSPNRRRIDFKEKITNLVWGTKSWYVSTHERLREGRRGHEGGEEDPREGRKTRGRGGGHEGGEEGKHEGGEEDMREGRRT